MMMIIAKIMTMIVMFVADDHHNVDHDDGDDDDEIVFPGRRSARGFFPSPLSGSRHSCSGFDQSHKTTQMGPIKFHILQLLGFLVSTLSSGGFEPADKL